MALQWYYNAITMPHGGNGALQWHYNASQCNEALQCPITLADTHRLKCADLSGIRLPLITISKNNFSEIHISQGPEWAFPSLSYYGSWLFPKTVGRFERTSWPAESHSNSTICSGFKTYSFGSETKLLQDVRHCIVC